MPLKWDLPPPSKRRAKPKRNPVQSIALGDGWTLYESKAAALGQTDARAVARAVRAGLRERAWAVRGEVPLEDDRSACGCTTVVFGGIRMHVPEKLFACSWMELRHAASGVVLCFDGVSALRRWAALSLELIDDRRAGQPA